MAEIVFKELQGIQLTQAKYDEILSQSVTMGPSKREPEHSDETAVESDVQPKRHSMDNITHSATLNSEQPQMDPLEAPGKDEPGPSQAKARRHSLPITNRVKKSRPLSPPPKNHMLPHALGQREALGRASGNSENPGSNRHDRMEKNAMEKLERRARKHGSAKAKTKTKAKAKAKKGVKARMTLAETVA